MMKSRDNIMNAIDKNMHTNVFLFVRNRVSTEIWTRITLDLNHDVRLRSWILMYQPIHDEIKRRFEEYDGMQ